MPKAAVPPAEPAARLSEQVYQTLLEDVLAGRLAAGEPVSELSLAKALGVSRTPVHEALIQLVRDGLVTQQANRRPVVAAFSADDIREVFEMRRILEGAAVAAAAARIDRLTLAALRADADRQAAGWDAPDWVARWADHDHLFHATIAKACGNRRLCREVLRYRTLHRGFNKTHTDQRVLRLAQADHVRILDALDRRDPAAAREAMDAHIRESQTFFSHTLGKG
jgi:DNA-binding GntR family transcriptional regulator